MDRGPSNWIAAFGGKAKIVPARQAAEKSAGVMSLVVTGAMIMASGNTASAANGLFQTVEERSDKLETFYKWNDALRRHYRERRWTLNTASMRRWHAFIDKTRRVSRDAQIRAVNRFANRFAYRTDADNYGRADYWATPREFFAKGGDAEDYAIVKYLTLKALGWDQRQLRLVVLIDRRKQMAHAVLAVHHAGRHHILDNQLRRVMVDTQITHYRPVYSINERNWWFHSAYKEKPVKRSEAGSSSD